MPRQVKCPICGTLNDKENTIEISKRYYCKECGENYLAEREAKKNDWDRLFEYICKIYNIDKPTGMMFKQLKEFREEPYNYKDSGMFATLRYIYEIEEIPLKEGVGLGLIPYYYDKTRKYYEDLQRIENSLENYRELKDKTVKIDSKLMNKNQIKLLKFNEDDWSDDNE